MKVSDFIRTIAADSDLTIEQLGIKIGRGKGSSFIRTVRNNTLTAYDLKRCVEVTNTDGEFIILFKGMKVCIS